MKIAILTTSYHPYNIGGGEISAKKLVDGLVSLGHEVIVIAAFRETITEYIDGIKVYRIKSPNSYWSADSSDKNRIQKLWWHLRESYNPTVGKVIVPILEKETPNIIHVRNITDFSSYVWVVGRRLGIPTVTTLNNYASICSKTTFFKKGKICEKRCLECRILSLPKKIASRNASCVVGVSEFTLNKHLNAGFFNHAIKAVVRTQMSPDRLPLPSANNDFLSFGFLGQIIPTKGVRELIKAFNNANTGSAPLYIGGAGDEQYMAECKLLAEENPNIHFLGRVISKDFYALVDVVVIPSLWHEPFPRILVEANAHARFVLATTYGGTKEMIEEGTNGYTFKNFEELEILLESPQLRDNCNDLGKIINESVNEDQGDIEGYVSLYERLLKPD